MSIAFLHLTQRALAICICHKGMIEIVTTDSRILLYPFIKARHSSGICVKVKKESLISSIKGRIPTEYRMHFLLGLGAKSN
jgi:hypothetical protein